MDARGQFLVVYKFRPGELSFRKRANKKYDEVTLLRGLRSFRIPLSGKMHHSVSALVVFIIYTTIFFGFFYSALM